MAEQLKFIFEEFEDKRKKEKKLSKKKASSFFSKDECFIKEVGSNMLNIDIGGLEDVLKE